MGSRGGESLAGAIAFFRSSPAAFLSSRGASDTFAAELLKELPGDRHGEPIKLSMVTLFLEYPALLCPDAQAGREAAAALLSLFAQLSSSPKQASLRCALLFAAATVLVATDGLGEECLASRELLSVLLHLASDLNDGRGGAAERPLRAAAVECLRELEGCYPGLLSCRLEVLRSLQQQEGSVLHQGYALLYGAALRNTVLLLAWKGPQGLGDLLASNGDLLWEATKAPGELSTASIDQLVLVPSPGDLKELRSVVLSLLDICYLLTPAAQSHLLWQLAQAVSVVRTLSPVIFKAQLVRLFSTASAALEHTTLQLKSLFTDSLFTAEDEAFLLRHLVGLAQHPALPAPVKLFHLDCLLHFPENRPLVSGTEERLPVLLTPRATSGLFPGFFQDQGTVLARMNLLCLVCFESEGPNAERGMGYLLEHLLALGGLVARRGGPVATRLFFQSAFIFAQYFGSRAEPMAGLTQCLLDLYRRDSTLAPNIVDLLDESRSAMEDSGWAGTLARGLQEFIVGAPLQEEDLGGHLKILARLAKEKDGSRATILTFLGRLVALGKLRGWRSGQLLLSTCRNLMLLHPPPAPARLSDLLHAVALGHADIDVRDRAGFYHSLLTNLSGEKLRSVLTPQGPAKTRSLSSSIVADSESFAAALTVHPAEATPLSLRRVDISADAPAAPPAEQDVDGYCRWLLAGRPPSRLRLTYQLLHVGPHDVLLCVTLCFACTSRHYRPVPELCVPCVAAHRPPQTVGLTLQPCCPYATQLDVSALYTTRDGLTRWSQLEALQVTFPDLFLPLPLPAWSSEKRHLLFDTLWHHLHPERGRAHAESLTVWSASPQSLKALVQDHFARYLLAEQSSCYHIAWTLPPRSHILLRVQSVEDAVRVAIRTDNWKLLPSLNAYLQSLGKAG